MFTKNTQVGVVWYIVWWRQYWYFILTKKVDHLCVQAQHLDILIHSLVEDLFESRSCVYIHLQLKPCIPPFTIAVPDMKVRIFFAPKGSLTLANLVCACPAPGNYALKGSIDLQVEDVFYWGRQFHTTDQLPITWLRQSIQLLRQPCVDSGCPQYDRVPCTIFVWCPECCRETKWSTLKTTILYWKELGDS